MLSARVFLLVLPLIVTLIHLYLYYKFKHCVGKKLKIKQISFCIMVSAWFVFIPVFIDLVITDHYYEIFHIDSAMDDDVWFAFLGSYMGIAGTIVIGAISFKQTDMLAKKDEKLAAYQAEPRIRINTVSALPWYSKNKLNELKKRELEKASFIQYGTNVTSYGSFVIIRLEAVDVGTLPVNRLDIEKIIWTINGKEPLEIELKNEKWKNLDLLSQIYLIIDNQDKVKDKFYSELAKHFNYKYTKEVGYAQSELQILFSLSNAEHLNIKYRLICRFDLENADVESDYVSSEIIHIRKE